MERFILQLSEKENYLVCTDTVNGIVCTFEKHNYNENQQFVILEKREVPDVSKLAKIANEMADWLRSNHYDKVF